EGRDQIAPEGRHQVAPAQVLGAVLVDEVRTHQGLHRGGGRHRQGAACQLLGEEAVRHHVGAGAPVGLRIAKPEVAELSDPLEELRRKLRAFVDRLGLWYDLGVDEPGDRLPELLLLGGERDHDRSARRSSLVAGPSIDRSAPRATITTPYSRRAPSTDT